MAVLTVFGADQLVDSVAVAGEGVARGALVEERRVRRAEIGEVAHAEQAGRGVRLVDAMKPVRRDRGCAALQDAAGGLEQGFGRVHRSRPCRASEGSLGSCARRTQWQQGILSTATRDERVRVMMELIGWLVEQRGREHSVCGTSIFWVSHYVPLRCLWNAPGPRSLNAGCTSTRTVCAILRLNDRTSIRRALEMAQCPPTPIT
jgi:hypothetical protein